MRNGRWTTRAPAPYAPFRNYMWPAFAKGIPSGSGAGTDVTIAPEAGRIVTWLYEEAQKPGSPIGYVTEPQFAPAVEKWANSEARRMRLEADCNVNGEFDGFGRPRTALTSLERWEKISGYHAERLGLDPRSLAQIRRDLAELHREQDAVSTATDLQRKYARRPEAVIETDAEEDGE
ncbi:MAG TPA: hypothetical protein VG476_14205 [Acidimicrobiales bacterium]|nr:hypothetical protein [Acidimicrobiales bacterium]